MSTTTIQAIYKVGGVLTDPDSNQVFLSDSAAAYGVKRTDTDAVVVADNTAMTRISTGVYQYAITDPAYDLTYQYATEAVISGHTFREVLYKDGTATPVSVDAGDLLEVVKKVVHETGRVELVNDAYGDDYDEDTAAHPVGVRYYIRQAQRYLDRLQETPNSRKWIVWKPSSGTWFKRIQYLRAPLELWYSDSSDGRSLVTPRSLTWLREYYAEPVGDYTQSAPADWAIGEGATSPEIVGDDISALTDIADLSTTQSDFVDTQLLVWMAPTDGTYTFRLRGLFYEPTLTNDTDKSYWTVNHPALLADVTRMFLEGKHRNSEGLADISAYAKMQLVEVDKDLVEPFLTDQIWG